MISKCFNVRDFFVLPDAKMIRAVTDDTTLVSFPCSCETKECSCCARVDIDYLNFHQKGCAKIAVKPEDLGVEYAFSFNNRQVYRNEVSGRYYLQAFKKKINYLTLNVLCYSQKSSSHMRTGTAVPSTKGVRSILRYRFK